MFTLNNGVKIPAVGLGTWQSQPHEVAQAVQHALKTGYRHIDGAFAYKNEDEVGEGIRASGVPRNEIFLTTKLWCTDHRRVPEALDRSLKNLGVDYLDLWLMHWPVALNPNGNDPFFPKKPDGSRDLDTERPFVDTWRDMEKALETGKVKAIGVSNFDIHNLEILLKDSKVVPAVNQVELHPYLPQVDLVKYCKEKNILLTAYSPLGSSGTPLLQEKKIIELAEKYHATPSQICVSYQVARGVVAVPKSVTPSRITENFKVVNLKPEDVEAITSIASEPGKGKRIISPPWGVTVFH